MIHSICGLQNSGKTLYMSYLCYIDFLSGRNIFSNYSLFFPHYRINQDFLTYCALKQPNLKNVTLALDESWLWFDSRNSMSITNKLGTYLFLQTSKNNINVYLTAQLNQQNESRLRNNAHRYSECERYELKNRLFKKIEDGERDLGYERSKNLFIVIKNFKQNGNLMLLEYRKYEIIIIRAQPFFKLYDTYEKKVMIQ